MVMEEVPDITLMYYASFCRNFFVIDSQESHFWEDFFSSFLLGMCLIYLLNILLFILINVVCKHEAL